jgi:hypothetical protein
MPTFFLFSFFPIINSQGRNSPTAILFYKRKIKENQKKKMQIILEASCFLIVKNVLRLLQFEEG